MSQPGRLAEWGFRFESLFPAWFTVGRALGFIVWASFVLLTVSFL